MVEQLPEYLARRIASVDAAGCWLVRPSAGNNGYLRFSHNNISVYAHAEAFKAVYGPAPVGRVLDHLCRKRNCINPAHLEAITQKENVQRGLRGRLITQCPNGHDYSTENTGISRGWRYCKTCNRAKAKANYHRSKNAQA